MIISDNIPEPVNFNPLKHHMGFIKNYISKLAGISDDSLRKDIIPALKHIGSSVADIYTGALSHHDIVDEINLLREKEDIKNETIFLNWIVKSGNEYRKCTLSDSSQWVIKYLRNNKRYFHIFPGRNDEFTIRSRGNSLKTAILFCILYDSGDILLSDLNSIRKMLCLSPIRDLESGTGIISDIRLIQSY